MLMLRITEIAPSTSSTPYSIFICITADSRDKHRSAYGVYFCSNYHAGENMFGLFI